MNIRLFKMGGHHHWFELQLGGYTGVRFGVWHLCTAGLWFPYKGDEVLWCWPWCRESGYPFISLGCEGGFHSLKAMDQFWIDFEEACR